MFKLGDFEFSKPPDVFKSNYGRRSSQFFVAGSLGTAEELARLKKLVDQHHIMDLVHELGTDRVFFGGSKFSTDAISGIRYELVLEKFTPLTLTRREIATNKVEDMGEKVFSPRFKVIADYENGHDELPRGDVIDYRVDLRVDLMEKTELFNLRFSDQYPAVRARIDFSKWTKSPEIAMQVLLGYIEQSELLRITQGEVEHIAHGISASGSWVKCDGKGPAPMHEQKSVYKINDDNLFGGKVERIKEGNQRVYARTTLLPDLRPGDSVEFHSENLGIGFLTAKPDLVIHRLNLERGAVTRFAFDNKT